MTGIPTSLYLFDTCCYLDIIATSDLVTHFQLFSYQLNDTIPSIGIAEHCSFIQLLLGRKAVLFLVRPTVWPKVGSSFLTFHATFAGFWHRSARVRTSTPLPLQAQFNCGLKIGNWTYDNSTAFSQDYTTIASLQQPA